MLQPIPKEETSHFKRPVLHWVCELNYDIENGMKICDSCRKIISKEGIADFIV
jgi:hypothetical protein